MVDPYMTNDLNTQSFIQWLKPSLMKEVLRHAIITPSNCLEHAQPEENADQLVNTAVSRNHCHNRISPSSDNAVHHKLISDTNMLLDERTLTTHPRNDGRCTIDVFSIPSLYSRSYSIKVCRDHYDVTNVMD